MALLPYSRWHCLCLSGSHVACRYEAHKRCITIFINGAMVAREAAHGPPLEDHDLYLNRSAGTNEPHHSMPPPTHWLTLAFVHTQLSNP